MTKLFRSALADTQFKTAAHLVLKEAHCHTNYKQRSIWKTNVGLK